jgi:putative membrane protein
MKRFLIIGVALLALPMLAAAQMSASPAGTPAKLPAPDSATADSGSVGMAKLSVQDVHFVKVAAIAGMAEVNAGTLAANMGDSTVKNIGNTMVSDHTKINQELASIAKEKGVPLPTQIITGDAAVYAQLKTLSGASFDAEYLQTQLKAHQKAINLFKAEASTGSDPDLKSFASSTLPMLEMHLAMIEAALK